METGPNSAEHQVFLSYGSPDLESARRIYDRLTARGLDIWFDKERLTGGQNWDFEIRRALRQATIIVILISDTSIERRGYVQREIKLAINHLEEKLVDDVYVIPVLLDESVKPEAPLDKLQCLKAGDRDFEEQLVHSITTQLERLGSRGVIAEDRLGVRMTKSIRREKWEGLPGYDVEFWVPHFKSSTFKELSEITTIIEADFVRSLQSHRELKLGQDTEMFHWSDTPFMRTNTFSADIIDYQVVERVLSLTYICDTYGAGAAHNQYHFRTYNFLLDPICHLGALENLFELKDDAFTSIQSSVREQLRSRLLSDENGNIREDQYTADWVDRGTENWSDFATFSVSEKLLSILFAPYHVACFAEGPHRVDISLELLGPFMSRTAAGFLGVSRGRY